MAAAEGNTNNLKYKAQYCEMLITHMGEGYSFESFGAIIKVGRKTLYNWVHQFTDWAEAKEIGEAMALKYFETAIKASSMDEVIDDKILQEKFDPKKINLPTMQWFIKSRFHSVYSEKNVTVIEGGDKPVEIKNMSDGLKNLSLEELKSLKSIRSKIDAEPSN